MLRINVLKEGQLINNHAFTQTLVLIGRDFECSIQIDALGVGKVHAAITQVKGVVTLNDHGHGTKVNGKSIEKQVLRDGDKIEIKDYCLEVSIT